MLVLVLLLALLGGGWLWVRDSPLVSVERVTVTGLRGPDSSQIHSALVGAARSMTTLDVRLSALRTAVAPFPIVKGLRVKTQFPHGMRIGVTEQVAVGAVAARGRRIAVASDGTMLPSISAAGLPSIPVSVLPGGSRLTGTGIRGEVALLAAAPAWLRTHVTQVASTSTNGLTADMHNGLKIYFGTASELRAKWAAAAAVLADPGSEGATYIDVTVPQRPAAGGVAGAAQAGQSTVPSGTTSTTGTTNGISGG